MRNTIPLTVLDTLRRDPAALRSPEPWYFAWYDGAGPGGSAPDVRGAILRTPPFELLLGVVPDGAMTELAGALRANGCAVPGVNGDTGLVEAFAASWVSDGQRAETTLRIRLYGLDQLREPPRPPAGAPRLAGEGDLELAVDWYRAFQADAGVHETEVEWAVRDRITDRRMWIWEDEQGVPVSLAARQRTTVGVARIGPVYTPPEQRRRGYGAAVTAACTHDALRSADGVVLFTDLANPVSNSIYQQIGYRPVTDRAVIRFAD